MNKYRTFLKGLDFAFEILIILLFAFIWTRYFIDNLTLSIILAIALTLAVAFVIARKNKVKAEKYNLIKVSNKKLENFRQYFLFTNKLTILNEIKLQINGDFIADNLLYHKNGIYALFNKEKPVCKDDIIALIQKIDTHKIESITILCTSIEAETANFAKNIANIHFEILNLNDIATKFYGDKLNSDEFANSPKIVYKQNAIITFKTFLLMFLRPQNAKGYFFSAIILIFASIIVPHKIYYYVSASILLILALSCKLIKNK